MYRRCIYCHWDLGDNETIEEFPIGRRLAFDGAKGRLWVICTGCRRWNLALLEDAWREAEEIAAIADRLLIPPAIEEWIEGHRK